MIIRFQIAQKKTLFFVVAYTCIHMLVSQLIRYSESRIPCYSSYIERIYLQCAHTKLFYPKKILEKKTQNYNKPSIYSPSLSFKFTISCIVTITTIENKNHVYVL